MNLGEIAARLGGEARGDPEIDLRGAAGIHDVEEGEITFLSDRRLIEACARSKASCVLVGDFIPELEKPQIIVKNPQLAFAQLLALFYMKPAKPAGISALASVSARATIGSDVSVGPFAYIADGAVIGRNTVIFPGVFIGDDAVIGDDCIIYPHVTVREEAKIGDRVIIHAGSVIGSDGFGYVFEGGKHHKIPQVGGVVVGDDVEIGSNVSIDRATTGDTTIGRGTKIDNLVQIAHNVRIGENSIIVAQVGIAGSSEIGNFVVLGGQVGVPDHVRISDGTMVGAQSGVLGDLAKGIYLGSPAIPHKEWFRAVALFARLPELNRRLRELEAKIKSLEEAP